MSDTRRVEFDTFCAEEKMKALADTTGMEPPEQAFFWLTEIAKRLHRGPQFDTWSSARDEAAKFAGIEPTMARRIWQRWHSMKDVSGKVLLRLMTAYNDICDVNEAVAAEHRRRRLKLRNFHAPVSSRAHQADRRSDVARAAGTAN